MTTDAPAIEGRDLVRRFDVKETRQHVTALDGVSFAVARGSLTALVGPDGAGKTTLIRMGCGLMAPSEGSLKVLGMDSVKQAQQIQGRISYMPQRFGLYEDLSVQENLDLYADLHGVAKKERRARFDRLLTMTDLGAFTERLAGKLSGGMKQKLGLACTLVRSPELLLLDEPTVGVDPLSRRELWRIVEQLVKEEKITVLVSTAYLDEAEKCDHVLLLREGKLLAAGPPGDIRDLAKGRAFFARPAGAESPRQLQDRLLCDAAHVVDAVPQAGQVRFISTGADALPELPAAHVEPAPPRLEDGFMILLHKAAAAPPRHATRAAVGASRVHDENEVVIDVKELVRKFDDFTAVSHTTFSVHRGEVFGLLGPNGAGKTTTFRMLCGLLPPTSGTLRVAGLDMRTAPGAARRRLGYVAQKFALYGNLSVQENMRFFAAAYGVERGRIPARIGELLEAFGLTQSRARPASQLPGGFRQRLSMATALLHEPEILFLDEPTSGADPLARRDFWHRITMLAEQGTTIVVTTHFMEEAEYCDRIVIQDAGEILALGTPAEVRQRAGQAADMEQAFIAIVEQGRRERARKQSDGVARPPEGDGSEVHSAALTR
ncbi:MAG: ATP-binding cassette domain-containing protein [Burkholderiaceae bacterium]